MPLVRVMPLKNFIETALSTTAASSPLSTSLPVSGQKVYGGLHLTAASTGRTLVMTLQSASSSGFGSLTTEITFALTSAIGATMQAFETPSTDRAWRRATWTLSTAASTAGSWNGLVYVGIQ